MRAVPYLNQVCDYALSSDSQPAATPPVEAPPSTQRPDLLGDSGDLGGKYVPETLMPALSELEAAPAIYAKTQLAEELQHLLRDYVGRATPLYFAERLTTTMPDWMGPQIYLKRGLEPHRRSQNQQRPGSGIVGETDEQAAHCAETGAGQHGVATATVC